jgi:formate/nitrite transporter FocA (FNT family)
MAVVFLSAPGNNVLVVKAGASALQKTILSSLLGAVTAAIVLGLGYAFVIVGTALIKSVALMSIGIALVVGVFWGVMTVLL